MKDFSQLFVFIYDKFCEVASNDPDLRGNISKLGLARFLGITHGKMQAWEKGQWPAAVDLRSIGEKLGFSYDWLVTGEGEMFRDSASARSARNKEGKLTGDLLREALSYAGISHETVVAKTSISDTRLEALLESCSLPTFTEMEELQTQFGLTPAYFFTGNELTMFFPKDPLLRVLYALGKPLHKLTWQLVEDIFDVDKDEAKAFLAEREQFAKDGLIRVLPAEWEEHLREKYGLHPAWPESGTPPLVDPNPRKESERTTNETESLLIEFLKEENARLLQDLKEQKEQVVSLLNAQNKLLDTNKLLAERLANPDGPVGKTAAGTKPAPGAHISIEDSEG